MKDEGNQSRADPRGDWLVGGGEMAKLIKAMDWAKTPLGSIESWPQSLRSTVSLAQASNSPISLCWGAGHVQIYNDGYWPICGAKHPTSMGMDFRECWASTFEVLGEAYASAWSGKSAYLEKMRMFLDRYGFLEETWFTFSFSPITDESGRVGGLFHPVTEMTQQMLSERRTKTLRDVATRVGKAQTIDDVFALSTQVLAESELDLPFVLFYRVDSDGGRARLVGATGMERRTTASPSSIDLRAATAPWAVAEVVRTAAATQIDDAAIRLAHLKVGPYPEAPKTVFAIPIAQPGSERPAAVMIAGVSPRLTLTESYRGFYDLVGAAVSGAIANARAYEEERQKAEALAEIDRAKTTFFSNVSHEFRTPLTLILGPVEDAIRQRDGVLGRESLKSVYRNALRMLRLVNSLLDFSRIEAGRLATTVEPTDLSSLTIGLAGSFRSLLESVGIALVVDCPPPQEIVSLDRSHWEKIVLNLLSNAFKFTFEGQIAVRLRGDDGRVELTISDTGTGIPERELPRIFERFHRVEGARGRSFEGTGIGLALVQELVKQLGGTVRAESTLGRGTTFVVSIPKGTSRAPSDGGAFAHRPDGASFSSPYLLEASQWVPVAGSSKAPREAVPSLTPSSVQDRPSTQHKRVLVADDNHDMREYLVRLLEKHWEVEAVADGEAALARAVEAPPDLLLSDVMMPGLDGFALLTALRKNPKTTTIPVVLLSARAGEEAVIEGLESGADDYLVKPFSARELLTRVRTNLEMASMRKAVADSAKELADTRAVLLEDVERTNKELEAFSYSVAHDLRAPLRGINGYSGALLEDYADKLDGQAKEFLGRIGAGAARMGELIDALLSLSRVTRTELVRVPVNLTEMAQQVMAQLQTSEPSRTVDFVVASDLRGHGDPQLLRVLLDNLLGNAWKFTSKSPMARIEFGRTTRDGKPAFFVSDDGVGFDMQHSSKLFSPFRRLHKETDFAGTGIGLATVQRIVRRHGGIILAQGAIDRGATFTFTLDGSHGEGQ
jgi:signal transduction histidine kinase